MKKNNLKLICVSGIFSAVVFLLTAYLHFPTHTGYTHIGDAVIYLAAVLLPLRYSMFVGAFGAFLADMMTGYAIWAPGSIIIKMISVLFFTSKGEKIISRRNLLALIPASCLCIGGYYLYESLITLNFAASLAGIPGYITQSVLSSILFVFLSVSLDKLKIKKYFSDGEV